MGLLDKDNNAQVGMTIQKMICDEYDITPYAQAKAQFDAGYNDLFEPYLKPIIQKIFREIKKRPVKCLTFSPSGKVYETYSPHNFVLDDGKTLSIRTNKTSDKIAPRVVGQCGIERFNEHFSSIVEYEIVDKQQIKKVVFEKIHLMLPIFIDYLLISDYTVWVYSKDESYDYKIIESNKIVDIDFDRKNFSFTKDLSNWNESTTLKYKGKSLAEIQIHKNRTFKFRFIMSELIELLVEQKITSETLGVTAEKTICDLYGLKYPESFKKRYSQTMQNQLTPLCKKAFIVLPKPIKHTGSDRGERGGESKCSYDFILEGDRELSLKTNTGKMVCPPEVGQPSAATCYLYFKDYIPDNHIDGIIFKNMVLNKIEEIFPIYIKFLFDADYLLWIYKKTDFDYRIFKKGFANGIVFEKSRFSFTKNTIEEWIESNTLKYDGISIGEFQVHKARDCYKFRFNLENFSKIVDLYKD